MGLATWWEAALSNWSTITGVATAVRRHDLAAQVHPFGTWWTSADGAACVELPRPFYAELSRPVSATLQSGLTWMLETALRAELAPAADRPLSAWLRDLAALPGAELAALVTGETAGSASARLRTEVDGLEAFDRDRARRCEGAVNLPAPMRRCSGHLLWLHFDHDSQAQADGFAGLVDHVVSAFAPGCWREWTQSAIPGVAPRAWDQRDGQSAQSGRDRPGGGVNDVPSDSVLLFVPSSAFTAYAARDCTDAASLDAALDAPLLRDGLARDGEFIRNFTADLLQVIEEDAFAPCSAAVSRPWQRPQADPRRAPAQDAAAAPGRRDAGESQAACALLASLVLAERTRRTELHRDRRIAVYGDDPLQLVVQALAPGGRRLLGDLLLANLGVTVPTANRDGAASGACDSPAGAALQLPQDFPETLQAMVDANLNVSEAARLLFVHRNTLLNRIERVREATGRDLRRFSDAAALLLAVLARGEAAGHSE